SAFRLPRSAFASSAQHTPAIDVENLARYVPRQLGAEKDDRSSHVLRARDPPQRDGPLDIPFPLSLFPAVPLLGRSGSHPTARDRPRPPSTALIVSSASARRLRYPTATLAPARASSSAVARPIPRPPPVTSARLPANEITV